MTKHFFIDVLSKDECNQYVQTIDSLSSEWTKRPKGEGYLYTLGLATHEDLKPHDSVSSGLLDDIKYKNGILIKNFPDLYEKILKAIKDNIGECELVTDKAPIPGFFIYGEAKPNNIKREERSPLSGYVDIHYDGQVAHLDYIWNNYNDVDTESISFTLPLEMPEYGAAFLLWDQPDFGCYMKGEVADLYKGYDYYTGEKNSEYLNHQILNKIPEVIEHIPGRMIVQVGQQFHAAAASTKPFSTDRRITLQGLGVKCDGIWRLFF
jgi:hypothetical protein